MTRGDLLTVGATVALSTLRFGMPTVPHSWFMVFVAVAHIYVGVMLCLLIQQRGNRSVFRAIVMVLPAGWRWWQLGWVCLMGPALLELAIFLAVRPSGTTDSKGSRRSSNSKSSTATGFVG